MTDDRTPCPRTTTPPAAPPTAAPTAPPGRPPARRLAIAGALLACAGFAPALTGATAAAQPSAAAPPSTATRSIAAAQPAAATQPSQAIRPAEPPARDGAPLDVLQLNLCHRDTAGCSTHEDTAVRSGIAAIQQREPDVVTLNEVCAHDITTMSRETGYRAEFTPELTADAAPVRCADGRGDHGIAVLTHRDLGALDGAVVERGFAAQDAGPARRVLLCAPFPALSACTAQLSDADPAIARQQCAELVRAAVDVGRPAVIGGDLNLTADADVRGCLPAEWSHAGDGAVQHVFADSGFAFVRSENLPVDGSSHPGLLAELAR